MLTLTRPRHFIPVHGEYRHLALHADLARAVGIPGSHVLPVDNGTVVEIDDEGIHVTGERVSAGYVYVDGLSIEEADDVVFRDRRQLAEDGVIIVIITVERATGAVIGGPDLVSRAFIAEESPTLFDDAREHVLTLTQHIASDADWSVWKTSIHEGLARFFFKRTHRRPLILPLVTEV